MRLARRVGRQPHLRALCAGFFTLGPIAVAAGDSSSASYASRGGHVAASGSGALASPSFQGGGSAGQNEAIGPSGATTSLTSEAGGFWAIESGGIPSLDLDGDGIQAFLDPDDDNDLLLDVVETLTGVFVSASDTGTNPLVPDTDGDGFLDGSEVLGGSDPNDALSILGAVPGLGILGALAAALTLTFTAWRRLRSEEWR